MTFPDETPTVRVERPVELAPPCPKLRRYQAGRAPSETRLRTSASVRDVLLTLGRSIGVGPEELDSMSAAEFVSRRVALRGGR